MGYSKEKFRDFKIINKAIMLALIETNFKSTNKELNDRLLVAVAGGKNEKKYIEDKKTNVYY